MGGLSVRRIKYALGVGADRTAKDLDEGAPVLMQGDPPVIDQVIDGTTAPLVTKGSPGIDCDSFDLGSVYYACSFPMVFSPSASVRILDALFEDTVPGSASAYMRAYAPSAVPAEPADFVSLWKWTAKDGNAVCKCFYGGIVKGFTLEGSEHGAAVFTPELVFSYRDNAVASVESDAGWALPTAGDLAPWLSSNQLLFFRALGAASYTQAKLRSWRVTASWETTPHFYSGANPDRITRGALRMDGEFTLRDASNEIVTLDALLEAKTTLDIFILDTGSASTILMACKLHAGSDPGDGVTLLGKYNFTMVETSTVGPFVLTVLPDRL